MKKATKKNSFAIASIPGGVTAALGFSAAGVRAGIKTNGKEDLALLASDRACAAAGTFTTNAIRASSVDWCESHLPSATIRGVVVNSGCANACTGAQGVNDTAHMARLAAEAIDASAAELLVASTGVIGKFLPMEKIGDGIAMAAGKLSSKGGSAFSKAIMTTDTRKKESAVRVNLGKHGSFTIGGCTKGSGMIAPNMATMLCFITADADIAPKLLSPIVKRVVDRTYNNLTVDGDTSTNDMVHVLANGASGVAINSPEQLSAFEEGLYAVCNDLCKQIAADGEGATKRVEINVKGAKTEADAKKAAKAVANSNLTKCALFGNDPNWGRISCAIGYSGAPFSKETMTIRLCGVTVFKNLRPVPFDERNLHALLKKPVVAIDINLGLGDKEAVAHSCDFSYDYVKINAEYHT